MQTRTGNFPIGFRRMNRQWHKEVSSLIQWASDNNLSVIDLGGDAAEIGQSVLDAGLKIGSIDLIDVKSLSSPDISKRAAAVLSNTQHIEACASLGPMNFFAALLPEDPSLTRSENFNYLVDSFTKLAPVLEANEGKLVIEGWPGPGSLVCTPETYRSFFNAIDSNALGVNFDPSHLIRMGIDPMRFLKEFVGRVYHVHGKDTEILFDNLYEYGHEQPATFADPVAYGAFAWRYTIPGHGLFPWTPGLQILAENGYQGCVSIELEDANFHGEIEAEQLGTILGAQFLSGA